MPQPNKPLETFLEDLPKNSKNMEKFKSVIEGIIERVENFQKQIMEMQRNCEIQNDDMRPWVSLKKVELEEKPGEVITEEFSSVENVIPPSKKEVVTINFTRGQKKNLIFCGMKEEAWMNKSAPKRKVCETASKNDGMASAISNLPSSHQLGAPPGGIEISRPGLVFFSPKGEKWKKRQNSDRNSSP